MKTFIVAATAPQNQRYLRKSLLQCVKRIDFRYAN